MKQIRQSRRDVLLAGASGLAACMTGRAFGASVNNLQVEPMASPVTGDRLPARIMLSLAGYSFRQYLDTPGKPGEMSLFDLADLSARLGLDAVEPTSYYFLRTDDEYVYELKHHVFKLGLTISGTPVRNNFALPPGPELDKEIQHVRNWVDICLKLGSPVIRVFAGRDPKNASRKEMFTNVVSAMKQACAYAQEKGVFLAIENHGYLTESADDVIRIVEAVDSKWLGVNLDTGNFAKDPYANIAKAAPYAIVCQIKSFVGRIEPGQWEPADYDRIIKIICDSGYRGYAALEYERDDPQRNVPIAISKLKAAVRKQLG